MNDSELSPHANEMRPQPQAPHWRRRVLLISCVSALVLGTRGYMQLDSQTRWWDALYYAVQMFTMHTPHLASPIPLALNIGRWLGAVTTLLALFEVVRVLFREEWDAQRLKRTRDHVIVCGLGRKGLAATRCLVEQGTPVVIIEKRPAPDMAEACRELGAHVLTGDAANPDTLRTARIEHAKLLIAICPDDSTNCEIAASACRLLATVKDGGTPLQCRVQVGETEARATLQNVLAEAAPSGAAVHFFDSFDPEARRLLTMGLPIDHEGMGPDEKRQAHLVILGFGRMGRALAVRAAQLGVFAPPGRLKISVIDRKADVHGKALHFHHVYFDEVCEIEFHQLEAISPETRQLLKDWCLRRDTITSVVVCFDDEQLALEIAAQLKQLTGADNVRMAVRMAAQSGLARLLAEKRAGNGAVGRFHVFGTEDYISSLATDAGEGFARKIHAAYIKKRRAEAGEDAAKLEKLGSDNSVKEWDELSEDLRESNRQQADHIHIKLRALGLEAAGENDPRPAADEFTAAQLEMLAEMEHRRWLAERRMANWTWAPTKNVARRESPSIVAYDKLTEDIKEYDRVVVRAIPVLLAGAGKKICRRRELK